jgi:hypothetical protein
MLRIISASLIIYLTTIGFADSATQTDWSAGDGVPGPVSVWGSEFYQALGIDWSGTSGALLLLKEIQEHIVDGDFKGATSVFSADVDGDGDNDILGSCIGYFIPPLNRISWWENVDGSGEVWTEHVVAMVDNDAIDVSCRDIDGDYDIDVIAAMTLYEYSEVAWWENTNGTGTSWVKHIVTDSFECAASAYVEDINDDGYMDVLGASTWDNDIAWWENADGSGTSWVTHLIDGEFDGAYDVYSEDIDGDGDKDAIGAAKDGDEIAWWENIDGIGTVWIKHTIQVNYEWASSVHSEDIDADGDMDVLGTARNADDITWWENIDGSGTAWIEHTIDGDFDGARSAYSEDLDSDGDMDVIGAAWFANDISWWENVDGSGLSWGRHDVDSSFENAISVYSEDIDGDGRMDVLGAAVAGNEIAWWRIDAYPFSGSLESSILDTQVDPAWDCLDWNSQVSPGTSVSMQVRSSDDYAEMGAWSDTLSEPCPLDGILMDGDQYVQYRVLFETADPYTTPAMFDITLTWDPLGIESHEDPISFSLMRFSPNPSSSPEARFRLPEPASVCISVFDVSGRLVSMNRERFATGSHSVALDRLAPGIYFCRMISGDFSDTQRFVVIE